ncbi:MAG: class I SAM-dependent methyltransferase [Promethearchaeota archaeon]
MSGYEEWDRIYRTRPLEVLPWELGRPRRSLVELVEKGLIHPGKALDLCCEAGTHALYLSRKGFQVTGIDISSKAVDYAKEKARKVNSRIQFQVQSFLNLENFEDEKFDFILDVGCFHHVKVKDRDTFIEGIYRVLKKESPYFVYCFSDRNGPAWNHFSKEELIHIFSNHFNIKNIEHIESVEGDGKVRYFWAVFMEKK